MAYGNKKHVAIVEPSLIVREGIKNILSGMNGDYSISFSPDLNVFSQKHDGKAIDFLIINPSFLFNETRASIHNHHSTLKKSYIIALVYNYINQATSNQFDEFIYIDDTKEAIIEKLKKLTPPEEEQEQETTQHIDLSDREKEILVSLTKGKTNKEIAEEHCISIHTVISHRKNISRKTGIRSVSGLTVYALLNKLINYSDIE